MTQVGTEAAVAKNANKVKTVMPCLTFKDAGEEAINFYVSLFSDSRVISITRSDGAGRMAAGSLLHATFQLGGQLYTAFDGGSTFSFSEAFSFVVTCETQQEIDDVWERLSEGGVEGPCGWLKARFGMSWQVVPAALGQMMSDPTSGNPGRMMQAMFEMRKLDIATLERAYRGGS